MALVASAQKDSTPNSAASSSISDEDLRDEKKEEIGELPELKPAAKLPAKKLIRQGSISDNFFAVKGAALILPRQTSLAVQNVQILKKFGGELQIHLRAIFHHLRPQDDIKLAVRLESWNESHRRYLVVISTTGRQDTEESIIVGCDFDSKESQTCTIGLVLPVWCDTDIRLDGDGGFHVECRELIHTFKPVSVQAMWSALQSLNRCVEVARKHNYFEGSLYLTWTGFYTSKITSSRIYINEWMFREDLLTVTKEKYLEQPDLERLPVEAMIRNKLKEVMMHMDLDNCTSRDIRVALEKEIDMDLKEYKEYIDQEMLTVLGQMDCASKILDYLYLGSEWNASNLEELESLGITHILNVTIEIDNFFPEQFKYKAVRLIDVEESELLPHWNHTWKFIAEAKKSGGKCLVHCRMGISRSAATVCAYLMKEKDFSKSEAIDYVKSRRPIISPNPGFQKQLVEYEGILSASSQRHNKMFRSRSESNLVVVGANEELQQTSSRVLLPPAIEVSDEQHDVSDPPDDFDFNRHLLDIATLSTPKVSRPKSWSPHEGQAPYVPDKSRGKLEPDSINSDNSIPTQNLSEPVELLVTPTGDPVRSGRVEELRRNFTHRRANLRRQTADGGVPLDEDFAHSDDSVFVHDGDTPLKSKNRRDPPRTSSPAALGTETLQKTPSTSSTEPNDAETDDVSNPSTQAENINQDPLNKSTKSDSFVKGHHKTLSLPPATIDPPPSANQEYALDDDVTQNRSQSCSDTPTSVKQIVTAIESLHSPEPEISEGIKRSASLPTWRKKAGPGNFALATEGVSERELDLARPDMKFFIGDSDNADGQTQNVSDMNSNNNNNRSSLSSVPEVAYDVTFAPQSLLSDGSSDKRHRMSPEILQMIREIGLHMNAEDGASSRLTSNDRSSISNKKRGVVRQMVREIEKGVRKLTGKGAKTEKKTKAANPEPFSKIENRGLFSPEKGEQCPASSLPDRRSSASETCSKPCSPGIDLVTPPLYRTPDTKRAASPGKSRFKLSVTVPRVRRTQSERAGLKPQTFKKPGYFRSFRTTESNLSPKLSLPTDCTFTTVMDLKESDDSSAICEFFERRSSSDDVSFMMSSLPVFRAASSPQLLVTSQSARAASSQPNIVTSQPTDQVRT